MKNLFYFTIASCCTKKSGQSKYTLLTFSVFIVVFRKGRPYNIGLLLSSVAPSISAMPVAWSSILWDGYDSNHLQYQISIHAVWLIWEVWLDYQTSDELLISSYPLDPRCGQAIPTSSHSQSKSHLLLLNQKHDSEQDSISLQNHCISQPHYWPIWKVWICLLLVLLLKQDRNLSPSCCSANTFLLVFGFRLLCPTKTFNPPYFQKIEGEFNIVLSKKHTPYAYTSDAKQHC